PPGCTDPAGRVGVTAGADRPTRPPRGGGAPAMSDTPVLDLLTQMTADSFERTNLDAQTLMLVRLAALVAVDAPPASYVTNLAAADAAGIGMEDLQNVLIAVAPIVGTARVASAAGDVPRGVGPPLLAAAAEDDA